MKAIESELRPCPFCGAVQHNPSNNYNNISHLEDEDGGLVSCISCGASINAPTVEEAIERWNRRAE